MPHLAQQHLTPNDDKGLYFGGAVVLSSSLTTSIVIPSKHCRPEVGSKALRFRCVCVPGLNGSSLDGELPLNPPLFVFCVSLVLWNYWRTSGRGSQPVLLLWAVGVVLSFLWL